jgi:hypothetical protein
VRLTVPYPFDLTAVSAWLGSVASVRAAPSLDVDCGARPDPGTAVLVASQKAARDRAGLRTTVNGDGATTLQELLPIVTLRHARRTADALGDVLERELPAAAPSVLRAARFVIEELGANIVQHSGVADTGFGTVRAWP